MKKALPVVLIIAVLVLCVVCINENEAGKMPDTGGATDIENVPNTISVEKISKAAEASQLLDDIGEVSVKQCLMIDGEQYDLFMTFDEPQKAESAVREKCSTALYLLKKWSILPAKAMDDSINVRTLSSFFDIYENEAKNAEITALAQEFAAADSAEMRAELYGRIMGMLPYTSK